MNDRPAPRAHGHARRSRRERGFTMVELLAALALTALMIAGVAKMIDSSMQDTRAQQAALYQSKLAAAARQVIQQNYPMLVAQATATAPVIVKLTGSPFQLSTYLPPGTGDRNAYGQTPCLLVYANPSAPDALQALLVTEGGQTIADPELGYIAANAGAGGGSIQALNNAVGAAQGAYGSWSVTAPNPAGASCSGTRTGVGHLASLVFSNGTQQQNADFLYRVGVPGNPTANTMQVPIVLAQQVDYAACNAPRAIAADAAGNVLNCDTDGRWEPQASYHWRGPVADVAALASLVLPRAGDVAITLASQRAYTFNGETWQALAVDEQGNLSLGNTQVVGADCASAAASAPAGTTLVSTDASGRVLSCRNGKWQTQAEIEPIFRKTGCKMLMMSPGAGDYTQCDTTPSTTNYRAPPFSWDGSNGTYSYALPISVTLDKPGIIVAASWAHMNDGKCLDNPPPAEAQLSQSLDVLDSKNTSLAHTESQTPRLNNDSSGINNTLTQAAPPGTYTVVVTTNWASYTTNLPTPWTSSFCGVSNQTIPNTPVAAGWSVNTYY
ncbi:shufflon system plasmid conjugative transfer pilus tip adhesin PilV [Paraburkholderia humisilvae]|nr:shufflon system plasmid conjugative transfer pilus tip adhesin PilV [Paraburkholderia humisilvae]